MLRQSIKCKDCTECTCSEKVSIYTGCGCGGTPKNLTLISVNPMLLLCDCEKYTLVNDDLSIEILSHKEVLERRLI